MAKKLRISQIENLEDNLANLGDKLIQSIVFSGNETKTMTLTFADGTTLTSTFNDNNTEYAALTAALINAGTSQVPMTISAKVFNDILLARLSAVMTWKETVQSFADLPTSGQKIGDMYNIENGFTYGGRDYPPGSNVAWGSNGWDVLHGFIDTSSFLTEETDPKGVEGIAISGGNTKTITITLRDGSTVSGNFTDNNTTYTTGTIEQLEAGSDNTGRLWEASTLNDFVTAMISGLEITVEHEEYNIISGNISGGNVVLNLLRPNIERKKMLVFLNGVKQPYGSVLSITGNTVTIQQSALPTPMIAGDFVEIFYLDN